METLELLGIALGLATLSGINLYLTVFVTGLAIRFEWIHLAAQYDQLSVLGDPVIIAVAGALYFLEFFADKIPWVDSLNDSVQTLIRPIGGALLAVMALGDANPVFSVVVGLLGGGMALTAHAAKAGTRLIANASPEPFSNIGLSIGEDMAVLAGLGLVSSHPIVALVLAAGSVAVLLFALPKIFRVAKATLWFIWRRIIFLFDGKEAHDTVSSLPPRLEMALHQQNVHDEICWIAPCVAGRGSKLERNTFGWLLCTTPDADCCYFATHSWRGPQIDVVDTGGHKATHERGLVCDRLSVFSPASNGCRVFLFDRSRRPAARHLAEMIRLRHDLSKPAPALALVG